VERTKVRDLISPHPLPLPNGERGRERGHKICERLTSPRLVNSQRVRALKPARDLHA